MSHQIAEALLWAVVLIAIALAIAAGVRIVAWIIDGDTEGIWRAAGAIVIIASGGGVAAATLRRRGSE